MTAEKLQKILNEHRLWLNNDPNGSKANLSDANLSGADLRYADLRYADLRYADLRGANLSGANLRYADLSDANLRYANLSGANLSGANLSGANLRYADLRYADLRGANLSGANLRGANLSDANLRYANLSGADGLLSTVNFMEAHFERTENGYIAYKTFGSQYIPPAKWKIERGSIIEENVNFDRCCDCGSGINVAPIQWVKNHYEGDVWKVLIRWEWLMGVCVPYQSDGKIRCERVELIEIVK